MGGARVQSGTPASAGHGGPGWCRRRRRAVAASALAAASVALRAGRPHVFATLPGGGTQVRAAPGDSPHQQLRRWLLSRRDGLGGSDLSLAYRDVLGVLRAGDPLRVGELGEGAHELPAMVSDSAWSELGRLVSERERPLLLDGSKWVSLRLQGCMFGSLIDRLRARGIVGPGYSTVIGEAMRACCRAVMDEFKANIAYTHSDEIVIILSPRPWSTKEGKHSEFVYQGRVQKWVSIGASVATALFNRNLWRIVAEAGLEPDAGLCAHFDCRAGVFDTQEEAFALLLWRAHDCGVTSARDACCSNDAAAECANGTFAEQMLWLDAQGLLPMESHQAYGSLFAKGTGHFDVVVDWSNETIGVNRTVNVHINDGADGAPRNLLNFERSGLTLMPGEGDPLMALRPGSYWRYAGPSGAGGSGSSVGRFDPRGLPRPIRGPPDAAMAAVPAERPEDPS